MIKDREPRKISRRTVLKLTAIAAAGACLFGRLPGRLSAQIVEESGVVPDGTPEGKEWASLTRENFGISAAVPLTADQLSSLGVSTFYNWSQKPPEDPEILQRIKEGKLRFMAMFRTGDKWPELSGQEIESISRSNADKGIHENTVGNEPNNEVPKDDPDSDSLSAKQAANRSVIIIDAIKRGDPEAVIIAPSIVGWLDGRVQGKNWFMDYIEEYNKIKDYPFDVYNLHLYDNVNVVWENGKALYRWSDPQILIRELEDFAQFVEEKDPGKPIWITEFGMFHLDKSWGPAFDQALPNSDPRVQNAAISLIETLVKYVAENAGRLKVEMLMPFTAYTENEGVTYPMLFYDKDNVTGKLMLNKVGEAYRDILLSVIRDAPTITP